MRQARARICGLCGRARGTRRQGTCATLCNPTPDGPYPDLQPDIATAVAAVTAHEAPLLEIVQRLTEPEQRRHEVDELVDLDNLAEEGMSGEQTATWRPTPRR